MSQDFLRRVDGYNFPFSAYINDSIARDDWCTVDAPSGPGRIEAGWFFLDDVDLTTPLGNVIVVTVDTMVVVNGTLSQVFGIIDTLDIYTPWCSRNTGATISQFHWLLNLDYESSASIAIQNATSPDPSDFYLGCNGRVGR